MQHPERQPLRPNVFVVGDAKCGTTSLHRMFELTESMGTARSRKELHFFSAPELMLKTRGPGDERIAHAIIHDEASYLAEFAHLPPDLAYVFDVSPSYLQEPAAAHRIHAFAPEARIVILLREPAAKVFSQYVHLWSDGRETLPFPEAYEQSAARRMAGFSTMFDYEAGGYYAEAVERYIGLFGRDRVTVIFFEEMFGSGDAGRSRLEAFLGLRLPARPLPRMNMGGRVKSPVWSTLLGNDALRRRVKQVFPLSVRTRIGEYFRSSVVVERPELDAATATALRRHYASNVLRLETILGRKTGWAAA